MKTLLRSILVLTAAAAASFAQQWEFGGGGGGGFLNSVPVSGGTGSATAGFQTGAAFGGYVGYNQNRHIGGELRYGYLQSNLKPDERRQRQPPSPACPMSSTTT